MTKFEEVEKLLLTTAKEILAKKGYTKTLNAYEFGGRWEKGGEKIDITIQKGHENALLVIEPDIIVTINGDPHIAYTKEEVEELLENL